MNIGKRKRGQGYWKLNSSLLNDDEYVNEITDIFNNTLSEYENIATKSNIWELCKIRFKEHSISYSIRKCKLKRDKYQLLENEISDLDKRLELEPKNRDLITRRHLNKSEYDSVVSEPAMGAQIRSRAIWAEQGERSTAYFLKLEKARQVANRIDVLMGRDSNILSKDSEILKECAAFYARLYSESKRKNEDILFYYLKSVNISRQLSGDERRLLDIEVNLDECTKVVEKLKSNKSPGLDGLTSEFYQCIWPVIGDFLVGVYNESFCNGILPLSQRTSVLSLIFKGGGGLCDIVNYRPITLSNVDYKIISFCFACRVQSVIDKLISTDQTRDIKKRFIGQKNIRSIIDSIEHAKRTL